MRKEMSFNFFLLSIMIATLAQGENSVNRCLESYTPLDIFAVIEKQDYLRDDPKKVADRLSIEVKKSLNGHQFARSIAAVLSTKIFPKNSEAFYSHFLKNVFEQSHEVVLSNENIEQIKDAINYVADFYQKDFPVPRLQASISKYATYIWGKKSELEMKVLNKVLSSDFFHDSTEASQVFSNLLAKSNSDQEFARSLSIITLHAQYDGYYFYPQLLNDALAISRKFNFSLENRDLMSEHIHNVAKQYGSSIPGLSRKIHTMADLTWGMLTENEASIRTTVNSIGVFENPKIVGTKLADMISRLSDANEFARSIDMVLTEINLDRKQIDFFYEIFLSRVQRQSHHMNLSKENIKTIKEALSRLMENFKNESSIPANVRLLQNYYASIWGM